jgi:hypothetical protein
VTLTNDQETASQLHVLPEYKVHMDNDCSFSMSLAHGSVLLEVSKNELHSTTEVANGDLRNPARIGVVFFQHEFLEFPNHGNAEFWLPNCNVHR